MEKKDKYSKLYHLSYDVKLTTDTNLKENLTWSLLDLDINASLTSPVESTIIIESDKIFEEWKALLRNEYLNRMYYVISEVAELGIKIDDEPNEIKVNGPYKLRVESIRSAIARARGLSNYETPEDIK